MLDPIALAIPVFLLAIGLEVWVAHRRGVRAHRFADAIADLGCGIGNQMMGVLAGAALLGAYAWAYEHGALIRFAPRSPWPWVIGILGVDFLYYWWHRFSHEVNVLWAAHVVHHQSEDYNLAVALRQAWFTGFTILPFYGLLAFAGVTPVAYATGAAVSLLYQFWIHTELIGRLPGPLEWVLNTPSHHRVHHAVNLQYLDRNYGGILIVWDRLFGTFEPEREPCVYGVTKPLRSFNPVWANFVYPAELVSAARRAPGFWPALRVFFGPPGWNPITGRVELPAQVDRATFVKHEPPPLSPRIVAWISLQFALIAAGVVTLLLFAAQLPRPLVFAAAVCVVLATVAWSGILERRRWGWPLELGRLAASVALVGWVILTIH